jgi:hypothetical protein
MSEIVSNQADWIGTNGADDPETADLISIALMGRGDYGTVTVERMGRAKLVRGPVSTLILPSQDDEAIFVDLLERHAERDE